MVRKETIEDARDNIGVVGATELALEDAGWSADGRGGRFHPNNDVSAAVTEGSSWWSNTMASEGDEGGGDPSGVTERGLATLNVVKVDMNA